MNDREKVETVSALLSVLQSREAFVGTCRYRAEEWARLVWFFYSQIESDNHLAAAILLSSYRKSRGLDSRQVQWLKGFDQWLLTWPSAPTQVLGSFK